MRPFYRVTCALTAVAVGCLMLLVTPPRRVSAHPMGNFTINQYSAITVSEVGVSVQYIVDMAEIPAIQELGTIRADKSTDLTTAERDAYTSGKAAELLSNLSLLIDGKPAKLTMLGKPALSFPPGAGGLPTLRLELSLVAPLDGVQRGSLEYQSGNFKDRIGWQEIIASPAEGIVFDSSTVPAKDLSNALRNYPVDMLNSPPRVSSASLSFANDEATNATGNLPEQVGAVGGDAFGSLRWVRQQTDAITGIMSQKEIPLQGLLVALLIAFSVGAAHALSPGHGKTVVAAYLVGSRGTALHAVFLGITVTLSHTIGVFLLGFVVLYLADYILPETLYPWLSFLSGALLVIMGVSLFIQRWRAWKRNQPAGKQAPPHVHAVQTLHTHSHEGPGHDHDHSHAVEHAHHDHGHEHAHSHDDASVPHKHGPFGRPHTHVPADGQKVTMGSLLVLGITGGIIPCPSALVVLLVAVASQKIGLGLLLILAFSLGLAVVLTGIGLLMVYSRNLLNRFKPGGTRLNGLFGRLPMVSALGVTCLGVLIALRAFNMG